MGGTEHIDAGALGRVRWLHRVAVAGAVVFVLSVMPGLPSLELLDAIRFQDQLALPDGRSVALALIATFLGGIVVAAGAAIAGNLLEQRLIERVFHARGLSGDLGAGFAGTWHERRVTLTIVTPPKRRQWADLDVEAACAIPLLFIATESSITAAADEAAGYAPVQGLGEAWEGLRVVAPGAEGWARTVLARPELASALRGLLGGGDPAAIGRDAFQQSSLRFEGGKLSVRWMAPDWLALAKRLPALQEHLGAAIAGVEAAPGPDREPAAEGGAAPPLDARTAARALAAAGKRMMFSRDSLLVMGAMVAVLAALFLGALGSARFPTLELWPLVFWTIAVAGALVVGLIATWKRLRGGPGWFQFAAIGLGAFGAVFFAYALVVWANGALDAGVTENHLTEVTGKPRLRRHRAPTQTWLELRSWRPGRDRFRIHARDRFTSKREIGDAVTITTRRGALGLEYWTRIASAPESGKAVSIPIGASH
jgi:hypothetical protein